MSKSISINGVQDWTLTLPDSSAQEWEGNMLHHHNTWELPRLHKLEELIEKISERENRKPVIMYIGAYKGDMAALLSKLGADLILMESTAAFWPLIKETWDLNDLPKPVGFWSGLVGRTNRFNSNDGYGLDEWPTRVAHYIEGQVGFSHLAESGNDPTFPLTTIDHFIAETGIKPDIITMDVEGSELEILYGAINTIQILNPAWLISVHPEFMFHNHGTYERELHDLLRDNGYEGTWLDYDHEHHWLYERHIDG